MLATGSITLSTLLGLVAPDEPRPLPGPASEQPATPPKALPHQARNTETEPEVEPEDVALATPRAVLAFPRYAFTGLFFPIHAGLGVSKGGGLERFVPIFRWNKDLTLGWTPLVQFQTGFGLSGGAKVFHSDVLGHGEEFSVKALAGGKFSQVYEVAFSGDRVGGSRLWIDTLHRYEVNPRLIFQGIGTPKKAPQGATDLGPRDGAVRTRFAQERVFSLLRLGVTIGKPGRLIKPGLGVAYNHRRFGPKRSRSGGLFGRSDTSIEEAYDTTLIPGFEGPNDLAEVFSVLDLDFRNAKGRPSKGAFFTLRGGGAPRQGRYAYWHYGTELTGYINLYKHTRVLVLRGALEALHGRDEEIPFTNLARLGGPLRLRGYREGRFRDKKAALATVEYRYPIHQVVGGHLFVDVGRVAPSYERLVDDDLRQWKFGYGGGFSFRTRNRLFFKFDVAYGNGVMVFFSTGALQAFHDRSKQL